MRMFFIWGTKGRITVLDTGFFQCPGCNQAQQYAIKQVRRWFTLYFIPLIPLRIVGTYIECQHCSSSFNHELLHKRTNSSNSSQHEETSSATEVHDIVKDTMHE